MGGSCPRPRPPELRPQIEPAVSDACCNFYNNIAKVAAFSHVPTLGCSAAPPGPGPGRPLHRAGAEDAPERLRAAEVPELSSSSRVPSSFLMDVNFRSELSVSGPILAHARAATARQRVPLCFRAPACGLPDAPPCFSRPETSRARPPRCPGTGPIPCMLTGPHIRRAQL